MQTSRNYILNWSFKFGRNPSNGRQEEIGREDSRINTVTLEMGGAFLDVNGRCILERIRAFD